MTGLRNLIVVLGDQLDLHSSAFEDFDPAKDAVWMAEVAQEATHVWCHKMRIAFFFSAMRHFRNLLGVHPYKFHEWHMAMYVDAVDSEIHLAR